MAWNVFFDLVENPEGLELKRIPWRCDNCNVDYRFLLKITIDYDTLILCKKCLLDCKKLITDKEKELRDDSKTNKQPKKT